MRPELSDKNPYWIERHRYYELKHFCLQYPFWKRARALADGPDSFPLAMIPPCKTGEHSDPTAKKAAIRAYYSDRIEMLETIAKETDPIYGGFVLYGVTKGISYDIMSVHIQVTISRDLYYDLYRRFFWLLDKARQ